MDRELASLFCEIAQKAALAKKDLKVLLESSPEDYMKAREYLNDIQETIAKYCDCAPIRLINNDIDLILKNHEI